jgi:RNA polymerase-associated protein RTF1
MIERRLKTQQSGPTQSQVLSQKSRLTQARNLAAKRHDYAEVKEINSQLATLEEEHAELFTRLKQQEAEVDRFGKVNEMNRRANAAAVKKAEEMERERRKLARTAAANGGPGSGASTPIPRDLSARVKTMPRVRHEMHNR